MLIKMTITWKNGKVSNATKSTIYREIDTARIANPKLYDNIKVKNKNSSGGDIVFIFDPLDVSDDRNSRNKIVKKLIDRWFVFPDMPVMWQDNFPYTVTFEKVTIDEWEEYNKQ